MKNVIRLLMQEALMREDMAITARDNPGTTLRGPEAYTAEAMECRKAIAILEEGLVPKAADNMVVLVSSIDHKGITKVLMSQASTPDRIAKTILDTREELIRQGLIDLGWTRGRGRRSCARRACRTLRCWGGTGSAPRR